MDTTPAATPEEIWRLLRELTQTQKETQEQLRELRDYTRETERLIQAFSQETDRRIQENERRSQENERRIQESRQETERVIQESRQETDRVMQESRQETDRVIQESRQETDRRLQEISQETKRVIQESRQETDLKLAQISQDANQRLGKLSDRLGEFAEYQVRPAVIRLFQSRNIPVREMIPNLSVQEGDEGIEVDLLVVNGQNAVAVEVKLKLSQDDVDEHLERLESFKRFMPRYGDVRLAGAVAGMIVPTNVGRYAYRKGLYVLAQSGDTMTILNRDGFQPRVW